MTSTQLRRNLIAIAAIIVLVPLIGWFVVRPHYRDYIRAEFNTPSAVVPVGHSVTVAGTTWSVHKVVTEDFWRDPSEKVSLPEHLEVVRVFFDRATAPGARKFTGCHDTKLFAGDRSWDLADTDYTDAGISVRPGGADTTYVCTDPERFQTGFLVPKGTEPDAVQFRVSFEETGDNRLLRFGLR